MEFNRNPRVKMLKISKEASRMPGQTHKDPWHYEEQV